jgi:hypothetical protein
MRSTIWLPVCLSLWAVAFADTAESTGPVPDDAKPDGTVTLSGGSVAAGIGYTWGHGELKTAGRSQRFAIKGISVVNVGATGFDASGNVYNLKSLVDFSGTYLAAGAGVAVVNGVTVEYLRNEHGVVIKLIAKDKGLKFNLSADGVRIALKS